MFHALGEPDDAEMYKYDVTAAYKMGLISGEPVPAEVMKELYPGSVEDGMVVFMDAYCRTLIEGIFASLTDKDMPYHKPFWQHRYHELVQVISNTTRNSRDVAVPLYELLRNYDPRIMLGNVVTVPDIDKAKFAVYATMMLYLFLPGKPTKYNYRLFAPYMVTVNQFEHAYYCVPSAVRKQLPDFLKDYAAACLN